MISAFSAHRSGTAITAAAFAVLAATAAAPASAATFNVGPETVVRHLEDVRLQNGSGEPLYLGYTITYHWFGLPYAVSRGGYVLAVKNKPIQYDLEEARVVEWQAQGHVPSPLPVYQLSAADHILGNLLWIVAGVLSVWYGGKALLFRRPKKIAAAKVDEAAKAATAAMAQRAAQVSRAASALHSQKAAPRPVAPETPTAARDVAREPHPPVRPKVQPQIQTLKQPGPRPVSQQASEPPPAMPQPSLLSQTMVTAMRMPVARTFCRVKALKVA